MARGRAILTRDARNGAVSVQENSTEAEGQCDGEHVQAGDLDMLDSIASEDLAALLEIRRDLDRYDREIRQARRTIEVQADQRRQALDAKRAILDRIQRGAA